MLMGKDFPDIPASLGTLQIVRSIGPAVGTGNSMIYDNFIVICILVYASLKISTEMSFLTRFSTKTGLL